MILLFVLLTVFVDELGSLVAPEKIDISVSNDDPSSAKVVVKPLSVGFGQTLGSALRRVMFSSLRSYSVVAVEIPGVASEFDSIIGVTEDVMSIMLNLKGVLISSCVSDNVVIDVECKGPCDFRASMIQDSEKLKVFNPEHLICTIGENVKVDFRIFIKSGNGYVDASVVASDKNFPVNAIPFDVSFSPVKRAAFSVSTTRVGQMMDYDMLEMTVETDGTITPSHAVRSAASLLRVHLRPIALVADEELPDVFNDKSDSSAEEGVCISESLAKKVDDLELSVRAQNCLKNEGVIFLHDLVQKTEIQMLRTPNFGKKSLNELKAVLKGLGLCFGMSVDGFTRPAE